MPCVKWYCRSCWTIPANWRNRLRRPPESDWGAIRWISDSAGVGVPTALERNGDFSQIVDPLGGILSSLPSSTQYTFYVSVVFAAAP